MKLENDENIYTTSDLALAATLNLYYPVRSVKRTNSNKVEFIFKKNKKLDLIIERFWRGELKVDALSYFNSLRTLKNRIYNN